MLSESLLKKVKQIELSTRKRVDDSLTGQFKSQFKGQGVQFSEHRQYYPGDDVRHIDWKVSARTRDPLIKKYEEERELVVLLVVDVSRSGEFGSEGKLKRDVMAEIGGMLAYAATMSGDKVGAVLFSGEVQKVIPPKRGKQQVLRLIQELLSAEAKYPGTDLADALKVAHRVMKHRGVVFVVSDFLAKEYDRELKRLSSRHDVVAIQVSDPSEESVPAMGPLLVQDPETGEEAWVDTSSYGFQKWMKELKQGRETDLKTVFRQGKLEHLKVPARDEFSDLLVKFFRRRSKERKSRGA